MSVDVRLVASHGGPLKYPHHEEALTEPNELIPIIASEPARHGVFKSVTATTQTTTPITAPLAGGAIVVTDLLITTNKQAGGIVTLRFTDGAQTVNLAVFPVDLAVNQSIAFVGLFRGWADAALEMVTSGATFDATVTAGYMKTPAGLEFSVWDALR